MRSNRDRLQLTVSRHLFQRNNTIGTRTVPKSWVHVKVANGTTGSMGERWQAEVQSEYRWQKPPVLVPKRSMVAILLVIKRLPVIIKLVHVSDRSSSIVSRKKAQQSRITSASHRLHIANIAALYGGDSREREVMTMFNDVLPEWVSEYGKWKG